MGEWGEGKTSYLNLMQIHALANPDVILIRINVWQSHGYADMAKKILSTIADGVGDISLRSLIYDYSKVIVDADIPYLSKAISLLFSSRTRQPEELFEAVSEKIKELNKCLIVQVDDLDRLTGREIFYTIKFIRNVAGFKNTFFIVAYDEKYLKNQFEQLHIEVPYMEKMFNIPYKLPAVRKDMYIKVVKETLRELLWIDTPDRGKIIDEFVDVIDGDITLRNTKRLANSVQLGATALKDADGKPMLDLLDYMLVQYLLIINPKAYDYLKGFKENNSFFSDQSIRQSAGIYKINKEKESLQKEQLLTDKEYIDKRFVRDVGDENVDLTYKIFQKLFDVSRNSTFGIIYLNVFPLYFTRKFDKSLIGELDFKVSFKNGRDSFEKSLKMWYDKYDQYALDRLITNHICSSKEEWLEFIGSILCITPKSQTIFGLQRVSEGFIPRPGVGLINDNTLSNEIRKIFYEAFYTFFFARNTLDKDSFDILQKKFALYLSNKNNYQKIIGEFKYIELPTLTDKEIFEMYWQMYLKKDRQKVDSYEDFDEDFWWYINEFNFQDKLDLREIATRHIAENIDNFMIHYPIERISSCYCLHSLFTVYIVTAENSAQSGSEWKYNFLKFLDSIKLKSIAVQNYTKNFNEIINNNDKGGV